MHFLSALFICSRFELCSVCYYGVTNCRVVGTSARNTEPSIQ